MTSKGIYGLCGVFCLPSTNLYYNLFIIVCLSDFVYVVFAHNDRHILPHQNTQTYSKSEKYERKFPFYYIYCLLPTNNVYYVVGAVYYKLHIHV